MDLSTTYLGLKLASPLVPSASPLSRSLEAARMLEDTGAGAIVMYSLFEEQVALEERQLDHYLNYFTEAFAEALSWHPEQKDYKVGPEKYLKAVRDLKEAVDIPVIGSLNGHSAGGWVSYAKEIEQAGADALELNVYFLATDPEVAGPDIERGTVEILAAVKENLSIPVAVKLSPYYSSVPNLARRLVEAGADGLVLFNRFYQPDLDLERLAVVPRLTLSTSEELRLPLRWTAILHGQVPVDIAITSGIHTSEDALKAMMAGAKVAMIASELLAHGIGRLSEIREGMAHWMETRGYQSVAQMQGSMSQANVEDPGAFERANYMSVLQSWRPDPAGGLFRLMVP